MSIQNKRVLLIAPNFFNYEIEIKNKITELGAKVDYFNERPSNSFIMKACIRINKNLVYKAIDKYYNYVISETAGKKYDYVFIINIESIGRTILEKIKSIHKDSIYILYMWDSIKNKKNAANTLDLFDRVYSFDKSDCNIFSNIKFRPLFFTDHYNKKDNYISTKKKIDLCFIGTVHSDRFNLISNIKQQASNIGIKSFFFMYFPNPTLFFYKKLTDIKFYKARVKEFSFTPMSHKEILMHIDESSVILDIQHPNQTGLTIRTIEALGAEKKIITTNTNIVKYDFYNSNNILVIDREKPILEKEFFNFAYEPTPAKLRAKYSITGWVKDIFEIA